MEKHFRSKNLRNPVSIREAASKYYVENKFDDPSSVKDFTEVDLKYEKVENTKFVNVNYQPAVDSHLTSKYKLSKLFLTM